MPTGRQPKNVLKQEYRVRSGVIEVKIQTRDALSLVELESYTAVVRACEEFASAHPPESPAVEAERIAREAELEAKGGAA